MRARTNSGVLWSWIAALLVGSASTAPAHAQDAFGDTQTTTLPDEPASAPAAQVPPEEADRKARALFQQGRDAYQEGRYRDAWDYFRQAYLLSKRPELLYNVGQAADRLRMDREALAAFRLYLKKLPEADNRREVQNRVRALEERLGEAPSTEPDESKDMGAPAAGESQTSGEDDLTFFNSTPPAAPTGPNDGQPTRSGWYVRMSLGLGLLHDVVSNVPGDVSLSSGTIAGQVAVGYDVSQGIVLGGMVLFDWGLSPSLKAGDLTTDVNTANLTLVMAFIDYYLAPRQDGWHLLGGLGFGGYSLSDTSATVGSQDGSGIGIVAGGGYEWPIDKQWAIGVLGRLIVARMNQDVAHHTVFAPSAAFTAAWY